MVVFFCAFPTWREVRRLSRCGPPLLFGTARPSSRNPHSATFAPLSPCPSPHGDRHPFPQASPSSKVVRRSRWGTFPFAPFPLDYKKDLVFCFRPYKGHPLHPSSQLSGSHFDWLPLCLLSPIYVPDQLFLSPDGSCTERFWATDRSTGVSVSFGSFTVL